MPNVARVEAMIRSHARANLAPAGQRRTVDGRDQRLIALASGDTAEPAPFGGDLGCSSGGDGLQIGPGAKDRTSPSHNSGQR